MLNIPSLNTAFDRRTFLQIVAVAGAAEAINFSPWSLTHPKMHSVVKSQPMMGTVLNLVVYSPDRDQAEAAVTATVDHMLTIEKKLSRFNVESEVSILNNTGLLAYASDDLLNVLNLARQINQKSSGAFDITVLPMLDLYQKKQDLPQEERLALLKNKMDLVNQDNLQIKGRQVKFLTPEMGITLDGIGKGYIVDEGTSTLSRYGFERVYVEAGGDLLVKDDKAIGKPWRIGIQNPRPAITSKLVIIEAENLAVATSGDYYQPFSPDMRLHHILNPRTGQSSPELASCTITAPSGVLADGLATACMVVGPDNAIDLLASFPGCEGYFIDKDLSVRKTSGFVG